MSAKSDQLNAILEAIKGYLSIKKRNRTRSDRLHQPSSVADVLQQFGADVNARNGRGDTLLTIALKNNDSSQVIRELLALGASVHSEMTRDRYKLTPLHYLLLNKEPDVETVKLLLDYKADVNARDSILETPLRYILHRTDCKPEVVELLLKYGADVTDKEVDHLTPLFLYLSCNEEPAIEIVRLLLKYKSDVNARNQGFQTPLHHVLEKRNYHHEMVELLLKHGADVGADDGYYRTPLINYFRHHEEPDLDAVRLLLHYKADVNVKDWHGKTPLHYILQHRNSKMKELVQFLLNYKADVTAIDGLDRTPLHYLMRNVEPDIETVKLLLHYKADLNAKDHYLQTPLHCVLESTGKPEAVELLLKRGANVSAEDEEYRTPLLLYLSYEEKPNVKIIKLLLKYKSNVNTKDQYFQTPLHYILGKRNHHREVVELLLKHGADVSAKDNEERTPLLHYFWYHKEPYIGIVKLLLHYKACVNAEDKYLKTPLHYIVQGRNCNPEVVELLLKYGADVTSKVLKMALDNDKDISAKLMINYTLINVSDGDFIKAIGIEKLVNRHWYAEVVAYINVCVGEIITMKRHRVNDKFSIYDWYHIVKRRLLPKPLYCSNTNLEKEIRERYPVYSTILWTVTRPCLERADLINQLEELQFTNICSQLGFDCLHGIIEYLSNNDLFNFISALRLPVPV